MAQSGGNNSVAEQKRGVRAELSAILFRTQQEAIEELIQEWSCSPRDGTNIPGPEVVEQHSFGAAPGSASRCRSASAAPIVRAVSQATGSGTFSETTDAITRRQLLRCLQQQRDQAPEYHWRFD